MIALARGARRQRKAWGGAKRNPRRSPKCPLAAHEVGDSPFTHQELAGFALSHASRA